MTIPRRRRLGCRLKVAMITGDAQAVADSVARRLGIDEVAAQVLPADTGYNLVAIPVRPGRGRLMKEWAVIPFEMSVAWPGRMAEAFEFVQGSLPAKSRADQPG